MSRENNNLGAPSSDDTSALFVTARKKQLEEQEAQRKAAEEERKRLEAEAEVRRLEEAVRQRKLDAEEEARRVEQEAAQIAHEARLKREQAEQNPESVIGSAPPQKKPAKAPAAPKPAGGGTAVATKAPMNQKTIIIIAAAVGAVVLAVVLFFVLRGGGGSGGGGAAPDTSWTGDGSDSIAFDYPSEWSVSRIDGTNGFTIASPDGMQFFHIRDATRDIGALVAKDMSLQDAFQEYLERQCDEEAEANPVSEFIPAISSDGSRVVAEVTCTMEAHDSIIGFGFYLRQYGEQIALFTVYDTTNKKLGGTMETAKAVAESLIFVYDGSYKNVSSSGAPSFPDALPGYIRYYDATTGVTCEYPESMTFSEFSNGISLSKSGVGLVMMFNSTDQYNKWISEGISPEDCSFEFLKYCITIFENSDMDVALTDIKARESDDLAVADFTATVSGNIVYNGMSCICYADTSSDEILAYFIMNTSDQDTTNTVNQIIRTMDIVK